MNENTEQTPLLWPEGWLRTRHQDRKKQSAWKKTFLQYKEALAKELKRMGATDWLVTFNRGIADASSSDPGVAVYFSRQPINNYAWQEALGFIGVVPTPDQIEQAYRKRIRSIHPDGPTPDLEMFRSLTAHRDRALAWAKGEQRREHEYAIACDVFNETRLNVNALRVTIYSLRRIEDCGSSVVLERAFRGFHKALTTGTGEGDAK